MLKTYNTHTSSTITTTLFYFPINSAGFALAPDLNADIKATVNVPAERADGIEIKVEY
jgi:hypothetical protein